MNHSWSFCWVYDTNMLFVRICVTSLFIMMCDDHLSCLHFHTFIFIIRFWPVIVICHHPGYYHNYLEMLYDVVICYSSSACIIFCINHTIVFIVNINGADPFICICLICSFCVQRHKTTHLNVLLYKSNIIMIINTSSDITTSSCISSNSYRNDLDTDCVARSRDVPVSVRCVSSALRES